MQVNVNCIRFRNGGDCLHQAAPRRWFGPARCIVWLDQMGANTDPRILRTRCALCVAHEKPSNSRPVIQQPGWKMVEGD